MFSRTQDIFFLLKKNIGKFNNTKNRWEFPISSFLKFEKFHKYVTMDKYVRAPPLYEKGGAK